MSLHMPWACLVDSWSASTQSSNRLLDCDNVRRQLRNDALQDSSIDTRGVWRWFDSIVADDVDIIIQIEQAIRCAQYDSRGAYATLRISNQ